MKTYELIIEKRQPVCGGKSPKDVKVMTVTTDDPVAYVRQIEKDGELKVSTSPAGELVVEIEEGARGVRYSFSEE